MRNQFKYHFQGDERLGSPIDGNEGKESMLDLIPFTGGWRKMDHRDGDLFFIGKFLQFFLPQSIPYPIGTTTISGDQQLALFWIERFSPLLPPPSDALDSKLSGIM